MDAPFYLTLPSDSSVEYFPNNTQSNYVCKLPTSINLIGTWDVALVEIMFKPKFNHTYLEKPTLEFVSDDLKANAKCFKKLVKKTIDFTFDPNFATFIKKCYSA